MFLRKAETYRTAQSEYKANPGLGDPGSFNNWLATRHAYGKWKGTWAPPGGKPPTPRPAPSTPSPGRRTTRDALTAALTGTKTLTGQ